MCVVTPSGRGAMDTGEEIPRNSGVAEGSPRSRGVGKEEISQAHQAVEQCDCENDQVSQALRRLSHDALNNGHGRYYRWVAVFPHALHIYIMQSIFAYLAFVYRKQGDTN